MENPLLLRIQEKEYIVLFLVCEAMTVEQLKNSLPPEFTLKEAAEVLRDTHAAPDKYLQRLVRTGELVRLKRDLYTVSFDPLAAANVIKSPSYVSFESALAFYGLIPEAVYTMYSVIDGRSGKINRNKTLFVYRSQERKLFAQGMTTIKSGNRPLLIATPEKALLDTIAWQRFNKKIVSGVALVEYVEQGLRVELEELDKSEVSRLAPLYRNKCPLIFSESL